MRTSPSQKLGIPSETSDTTRSRWSVGRLRRSAARTPSGRPTTTARRMPARVSSNVAGKRASRSSKTGRPLESETPILPRAKPPQIIEVLHGERLVEPPPTPERLQNLLADRRAAVVERRRVARARA